LEQSVEYPVIATLLIRKHKEKLLICEFTKVLFFFVGNATSRDSNAISIAHKMGNSTDIAQRSEDIPLLAMQDL